MLGDLGHVETAHQPQRQHQLRPGHQRRVAGHEEQGHPVVERRAAGGQLVGADRVVRCHGVLLGDLGGEALEHATTTVVVDPSTLGDADAPRGQVVGRPALVRLLHGAGDGHRGVLLGVVDAARPRCESAYDAGPGSEELLGVELTWPHHPIVSRGG